MSVSQSLISDAGCATRVSKFRRAWRKFSRNKFAVVALFWLFIIAVTAAFTHWLAPDPLGYEDWSHSNAPPSWRYPFGTNELGENMVTMVMYGVRYSMTSSAGATLLSFVIGTAIGLVAGMGKSWLDETLMRLTDFMFAFPTFVLSMIIIMATGHSLWDMAFALGVVQWAGFSRLTRGMVLTLRDGELIESGRAIGASPLFIALRYVLPNVLSSLLIYAAFTLVNIVTIEATIGLMGLGPLPPYTDFGSLISTASQYVLGFQWLMYCPVLVLATTLAALVVVGEGLQSMMSAKEGM